MEKTVGGDGEEGHHEVNKSPRSVRGEKAVRRKHGKKDTEKEKKEKQSTINHAR